MVFDMRQSPAKLHDFGLVANAGLAMELPRPRGSEPHRGKFKTEVLSEQVMGPSHPAYQCAVQFPVPSGDQFPELFQLDEA